MITIDRLRQVHTVIHHNDADGIASALVCSAAFKLLHPSKQIKFVKTDYGTLDQIVPEAGVLFVDICPRKDTDSWKIYEPIVLDHHVTVKDIIEMLGGEYGDSQMDCGATLTFKHVLSVVLSLPHSIHSPFRSIEVTRHFTREWAKFCHFIMLYDTWKKNDPSFKDAQILATGVDAIGEQAIDQSLLFDSIADLVQSFVSYGEPVRQHVLSNASEVIKYKHLTESRDNFGRRRICAFLNYAGDALNDSAELMKQEGIDMQTFVVCSFDNVKNKFEWRVSFRSNGVINVGKLAKHNGGGGHAQSAGCTFDGELSYSQLIKRIMLDVQTTQD